MNSFLIMTCSSDAGFALFYKITPTLTFPPCRTLERQTRRYNPFPIPEAVKERQRRRYDPQYIQERREQIEFYMKMVHSNLNWKGSSVKKRHLLLRNLHTLQKGLNSLTQDLAHSSR